jgi:hypothetical protein
VAALSHVAYGGDSAVNNIRPEQQAETFTESLSENISEDYKVFGA